LDTEFPIRFKSNETVRKYDVDFQLENDVQISQMVKSHCTILLLEGFIVGILDS
jgi:hypothetical protein